MAVIVSDPPLLSILIVNHNGLRFLDACLASIRAHVHCAYEVVIVDNASTDGSVEHLRVHHPGVAVHASEVNTGFTGGNNLAARLARGEYLLLLNNDTVLRTSLAPAFEALSRRCTIVGCRMFYGDGRQQLSYGREHTVPRLILSWLVPAAWRCLPPVFRRVEANPAMYAEDHASVAWVSGAFMLMRRATWDALSGFDTAYFMYLEDVDLCRRERQRGGRIGYCAGVAITHYEGAGRPWLGRRALVNSMNSYMLFTQKFEGPFEVLALRGALAPIMLARSLAFGLRSMWASSAVDRDKCSAYFAAAMTLVRGRPWGLSS